MLHSGDDWYGVTRNHFVDYGGENLLKFHYKNSHVDAVIKILEGKNDWMVWRFRNYIVPRIFWENFVNQQKFMTYHT